MTAPSAPSRPDTPPSQPDPTRTGAVWVTGTGAFLLLAAASVFVAVNWGAIPDTLKLGVLLLATGGFLIAGRSLKSSLPATAGALFHLGTFLVPINVAAIGLHAELDWADPAPHRGRDRHRDVRVGGDHRAIGGAPLGVRGVGRGAGRRDRRHHRPARSAGAGGVRGRGPGLPPRCPGHRLGRAGRCGAAAHLRGRAHLPRAPAPSSASGSPVSNPAWPPCSPASAPRWCSASSAAVATMPVWSCSVWRSVPSVPSRRGPARAPRRHHDDHRARVDLPARRAGRLRHPRRRVLERPVRHRRPRSPSGSPASAPSWPSSRSSSPPSYDDTSTEAAARHADPRRGLAGGRPAPRASGARARRRRHRDLLRLGRRLGHRQRQRAGRHPHGAWPVSRSQRPPGGLGRRGAGRLVGPGRRPRVDDRTLIAVGCGRQPDPRRGGRSPLERRRRRRAGSRPRRAVGLAPVARWPWCPARIAMAGFISRPATPSPG